MLTRLKESVRARLRAWLAPAPSWFYVSTNIQINDKDVGSVVWRLRAGADGYTLDMDYMQSMYAREGPIIGLVPSVGVVGKPFDPGASVTRLQVTP